ncbi:two-component regulator propeller domain-containing protein [Chitinophaga sp. MM2321]|uniref:ligand-binding sensor domain-containing protein n=1 Tax=Chitinophaga sp. MM2321 TaxID=3137178 RepID=UPI0032D576E8
MKFYFCILLLLAGQGLYAQSYYFRHYEVENGLSHNTVSCSVQDKEGFMWFGTRDGLNRFDGHQFKTWAIESENPNRLSISYITALALDSSGVLWVGTQKGIYRFDKQKERLVPVIDTLKSFMLMVDRYNQLWIISNNIAYIYEIGSNKIRRLSNEAYFDPICFCQSADGTVWIGTRSGYLCRFNNNTGKIEKYNLFSHSSPTEFKSVLKIAADQNGFIYIGTLAQGIKKFSTATLTYTDILDHHSDGSTIFVLDILQVNEQEIWFGTEGGILVLNNQTGEFHSIRRRYLDPYSISDNAIYTICKDREGGIWVGTYFGGINYLPNRYPTFEKFFPDNSAHSIGGNAVREICQDSTGNLWIATEDAGITRLNPKTREVKHFMPGSSPGSIAHSNIHGLLVVKNDLWIGTHLYGLDIMDIRTGKVKRHYNAGTGKGDLKSGFILTFLQTRSGDIYIGNQVALYKYNPSEDNFMKVATDWPEVAITSLMEDKMGIIWVGTNNGLYFFNPLSNTGTRYENKLDSGIMSMLVSAIYQDSYDYIWVATEGNGIWRFDHDGKNFRRYTTADGLPGNTCFKVLEDNYRTLWITTTKGLVNMSVKDGVIAIYKKADGLLSDQFNYNSGYKDREGNLYFGSIRGMIAFKPSLSPQSRFVPRIYITGFQVKNNEVEISPNGILHKSILFTDEIVLPYNKSTFSIDFAAASFASPERILYSYRMDGIDNDWNRLKSNQKVYFTDLKPGKYTFRVKAAGPDFQRVAEKELGIRILPPIWSTIWAYLLYFLIFAGLTYYLLRSYRHIQHAKKEKEIIDAKMEFFTNIAHEIKTPLTLIKGPVDNLREIAHDTPEIEEDLAMMERNTDRLINLVSQILDFRQTEVKGFRLSFERVNINLLLEEAFDTFNFVAKKRKLLYEVKLPHIAVVSLADGEALYKIFTNLISNAVKYASTTVNIRLIEPVTDTDNITLEVSNDGALIAMEMKEKIFEPFFRIKETAGKKGTGIGLTLARSLAELHGGSLYLQRNEENMNTFILTIPYKSPRTKPDLYVSE